MVFDPQLTPFDGDAMKHLRSNRDIFLKESDWTVMADSPLSESKQDEWKVYRQALRDLPVTSPSPDYDENHQLANVDFPVQPTND